jgi:hypothetical protein
MQIMQIMQMLDDMASVQEGRRLQFGGFNQPIGFWVGVGIGGAALLTLLVFMSWYCCCFDQVRTITIDDAQDSDVEGGNGAESMFRFSEEDLSNANDDTADEGEDGKDGDDEEEANTNDTNNTNDLDDLESPSPQNGEEADDDSCKVVVTYDHCDIAEHSKVFQKAAKRAGLSGWTFSSVRK